MNLVRRAIWILLVLLAAGEGKMRLPSNQLAAQQASNHPAPLLKDDLYVEVSVDYGAQLALTDSKGRKTGYDPATAQMLNGIPGASYFDDSISDVTDDSSAPAAAESRVLQIHPTAAGRYSLKVSATDRHSYNIQFFCTSGRGPAANISGRGLGIGPGREHSFALAIAPDCLGELVSGAFSEQPAPGIPALTYAYPDSDHIHLTSGDPFRLVIVYHRRLDPSSFAATLNGNTIRNLFHPNPNTIEGVTIHVKQGRNVVQLSAAGTPGRGSPLISTDSFIVEVE